MNVQFELSPKSSSAQAEKAVQASAPCLCVHKDGRISYLDLTGRWIRYVTAIPADVYFQASEHRRRRLFSGDAFSGTRRNGQQIVIIRTIVK
jgi:hypothetical protein